LLSQRHCRRCVFRSSGHYAFHLPGTLRSTGVTRLHHYYGSSDSCPTQSCRTGLFASWIESSERSDSNHPPSPGASRVCVLCSGLTTERGFHASTGTSVLCMALRLRHSVAGSPRRQAESSSLAFRTARSPSDALHPASRRRSFGRLQNQTLTS